jgi:hypothetical protein
MYPTTFGSMRVVGVLTLSLMILVSTFKDAFIYAAFNINKKYIIENLCVNREKPELKCKGSCFLMKKLSKSREKEKNTPLPLPESNQPTILFKNFSFEFATFRESGIKRKLLITNDLFHGIDFVARIFRPPKCSPA